MQNCRITGNAKLNREERNISRADQNFIASDMECTNKDVTLALELNKEYNQEENTEKEDKMLLLKSALSIVSSDWETLDPTPDLQALFLEFNNRFFFGKLLFCTVDWANTMEIGELAWAGKCEYLEQNSRAHITLSEQILKRRPRKDTIETLLHEMIHAYLFMTRGIFDGHGSEFVFHMDRINQETGASITVKHCFNQEVDMVMSEILQGSTITEKSDNKQLKEHDSKDEKENVVLSQKKEKQEAKEEKTDEAINNNYTEKDTVEDIEDIRVEDIARIRFLLFSGRSGTKHFHPDSTLAEVYSFAQNLLMPATTTPSLSSMSPNQSLDMLPKDQTLRQLGFVPSATIMVVPGAEHQEQPGNWVNSLLSINGVIMVICLACFLVVVYQPPTHQEYQKISLPDAEELAGGVRDLAVRLLGIVGCFIEGLGGLYCIFGYIFVFCVLRSMYVGLPYGRLVWVGGYDHN